MAKPSCMEGQQARNSTVAANVQAARSLASSASLRSWSRVSCVRMLSRRAFSSFRRFCRSCAAAQEALALASACLQGASVCTSLFVRQAIYGNS